MTRSLKIYQGEDATPVIDVTEPSSNVHVIWEEVEAGGRAYRGESTLASFPMRDERGETGSGAGLPSNLTATSLSAGSRIEWLVNGFRLFRGRIGPKDYSRGRQKADRARELVLSANDTNYDLRNIIIDGWSRPQETDVARVQALITTYLSGSPRASTVITNDYVVTGSNTVTLGPKVYDATGPAEVLSEIATIADKLHFVTIDDELFYDGYDSSIYQAGIRISDRSDELNTAGACASSATPGAGSADMGFETPSGDLDLTIAPNASGGAIYLFIHVSAGDATWPHTTPAYYPDGVGGGGARPAEPFTLIHAKWRAASGSMAANTVYLFRLLDPSIAGVGSVVRMASIPDSYIAGAVFVSGVDQADPNGTPVDNTGTGAASSLSAPTAGPEQVVINWASWRVDNVNPGTTAPTAGGGQTVLAAAAMESSFGVSDAQAGLGYGSAAPTWTWVSSQPWTSMGLAVNGGGTGSGDGPTFPPIWDVGPSSTEDGLELLSGLRLYYGQGSNTYVYVNDPTTANQYWHSEQSLYTNDPLIDTAAKATTLAQAILQHRKFERRTYNVSIGPLSEDQVGCLKPGQIINIKARAIPDADDNFVARRIAQLRWTTPVPGTYFAHMMLDRPMKDSPSGIGPKSATDSINRHVEQGSNSHPEYVLRGTLTAQGDLPYRGASDWTRLAIGASNTQLVSTGQVPVWAPKDAGGSGMTNPMTTAGDIIKGGASGAAQRLAIGTAGQVLTVNAGATAPEWAAAGGGGYDLVVNADGTVSTPFTVQAGTWSSDGASYGNTVNPGAAYARSRYDTKVPFGRGFVAQVEMQFPTASQGTGTNVQGGLIVGHDGSTSAGALVGILDTGTAQRVEVGRQASASITTYSTTIAKDTWYTLRMVVSGSYVSTYLDGTLLGTALIHSVAAPVIADYLQLIAYNSLTRFRNLKCWFATLP